MDSYFEPTFYTIDCTETLNEVVLVIHLGEQKSTTELKSLMFRHIKKSPSYKVLFFEQNIRDAKDSGTHLLVKKMMHAGDRFKMIFYTTLKDEEKRCEELKSMFAVMEKFRLPMSTQNLGFVIFNATSAQYGFNSFEECISRAYDYLNCATVTCIAFDILITTDRTGRHSNMLILPMESKLTYFNSLYHLINERLQFTNLTASDVDVLGPQTVERFREYQFNWRKHQDLRNEISLRENNETDEYLYINTDYISDLIQRHQRPESHRKKRSSESQELAMRNLLMKIVAFYSSNRYTSKILRGILRIVEDTDTQTYPKYVLHICAIACNRPSKYMLLETRQRCPNKEYDVMKYLILQVASKYAYKRNKFIEMFAALLENEHINHNNQGNIKVLTKEVWPTTYIKMRSMAREWVRVKIFEQAFQSLVANFTWRTVIQDDIGLSLDCWISKLTKWADEVPLSRQELVPWQNFSRWIAMPGHFSSDIKVEETEVMIRLAQTEFKHDIERGHEIRAKFQTMIRGELHKFCRNVTEVPTQQLASTKIKRADGFVAALDQSFLQELKGLHHGMDLDQWILLRPQIFYHLVRIQQARQNFNHFFEVMDSLFDIHHFERPVETLAKLEAVNAEFDVYQEMLGPYINGSINTTQEWGREFRESYEYIKRNSGAQPMSMINDAAKWITRSGHGRMTMQTYDFGGSLMLLHLIARKWARLIQNWWWPRK